MVAFSAAGLAAVSCSSSNDERPTFEAEDASREASVPPTSDDAEVPDALTSRDASFDAAALAVSCTSDPCATSLVTTLGTSDTDGAEGFCALLRDGTVACWGANQAGQLGRADEAGALDSPSPARVVGLTNIVRLEHTCAIDADGGVFCWGTGPFLQSDAQVTSTERTPVKLPIPSASYMGFSPIAACAELADGPVCWGSNTLAQVAAWTNPHPPAFLAPSPVATPNTTPVRNLYMANATFRLHDDGIVDSWGANPAIARESSLAPDPYPAKLALEPVSHIDVVASNGCAVSLGIGYCWGAPIPEAKFSFKPDNLFDRALPEPVIVPEPVHRIATTNHVVTTVLGDKIIQPQRWCAVGASGALFCWGFNASGQAGDGTQHYASEAVKVVSLAAPAADVKTTPNATCALLTTGKVHCWGSNFYGQLGTGKLKASSLVPQEVVLP
ncbi:hypothetical protein AKJ09_01475 [Labilithrix luteola]|uniref:BNR repeat domain protein n=1 Tax=Labilithrix luteola TaxID=1391654 RepID=A0A0K1PN45_9BACT|nr:hypothetical protein [Labilithrix luteola]AKU94811.1 hypothetical protein AKJ09_01475 [Labilithrix luteola]